MINTIYTIFINLFGVDPTKIYLTAENEYVILSDRIVHDFKGGELKYVYRYVNKGKLGRFYKEDKFRTTNFKLLLKPILEV